MKSAGINGNTFVNFTLHSSLERGDFLGQQSAHTLSHLLRVPTMPLLWIFKRNPIWWIHLVFFPSLSPAIQVTYSSGRHWTHIKFFDFNLLLWGPGIQFQLLNLAAALCAEAFHPAPALILMTKQTTILDPTQKTEQSKIPFALSHNIFHNETPQIL